MVRGKPVAVKVLPIALGKGGEVDEHAEAVLNDFRNECAVMRYSRLYSLLRTETRIYELYCCSKLLHPNVLLLMGVCIDKEANELLMVTELMEQGSVFDILHRRNVKISFAQKMRIAKDCALGMNYLHLNRPSPILYVSKYYEMT